MAARADRTQAAPRAGSPVYSQPGAIELSRGVAQRNQVRVEKRENRSDSKERFEGQNRKTFGCRPARSDGLSDRNGGAQNTWFQIPQCATIGGAEKNPYAGQASAAKAGARFYYLSCSSCHGENAQGVGDTHSLHSQLTQTARDGELFWFITSGEPEKGMPPFTSLSEQQRWQIVTYIKSLSVSKPKRRN
jgi:mono/diheme cytochrome c family protein